MKRQCNLLKERNAVISTIKGLVRLEGLGSFLSPDPFDTLHHAALHGPVIIINNCELGSDIIYFDISMFFLLPMLVLSCDLVTSGFLAYCLAWHASSISCDFVFGFTTILCLFATVVTCASYCLWI
jgi:hypothetical protein